MNIKAILSICALINGILLASFKEFKSKQSFVAQN